MLGWAVAELCNLTERAIYTKPHTPWPDSLSKWSSATLRITAWSCEPPPTHFLSHHPMGNAGTILTETLLKLQESLATSIPQWKMSHLLFLFHHLRQRPHLHLAFKCIWHPDCTYIRLTWLYEHLEIICLQSLCPSAIPTPASEMLQMFHSSSLTTECAQSLPASVLSN